MAANYRMYIKMLRNKYKWSVKDLAKFCCVSTSTVQAWECGIRNPSKSALKLMRYIDKLI